MKLTEEKLRSIIREALEEHYYLDDVEDYYDNRPDIDFGKIYLVYIPSTGEVFKDGEHDLDELKDTIVVYITCTVNDYDYEKGIKSYNYDEPDDPDECTVTGVEIEDEVAYLYNEGDSEDIIYNLTDKDYSIIEDYAIDYFNSH